MNAEYVPPRHSDVDETTSITLVPRTSATADTPDWHDPVLGVVAIYSERVDPGTVDPMLGCAYPLRRGEAVFFGRHAQGASIEARERVIPITHQHVFPKRTDLFGTVSRTHLVVEMCEPGRARLTCFSANGFYVESLKRSVSPPHGGIEELVVDGDQRVHLSWDVLRAEFPGDDAAYTAAHAHLTIQIVALELAGSPR